MNKLNIQEQDHVYRLFFYIARTGEILNVEDNHYLSSSNVFKKFNSVMSKSGSYIGFINENEICIQIMKNSDNLYGIDKICTNNKKNLVLKSA